jgi:hypothetical protein
MIETLATNSPRSESLTNQARDAGASMTHTTDGFVATVEGKVDAAAGAVGVGMKSLAGTIHEKCPTEGVIGAMSSKTAETLDTAGQYLQKEGVTGMAEDVTNLIRRNPIPALLIGLGGGFLLARALRR